MKKIWSQVMKIFRWGGSRACALAAIVSACAALGEDAYGRPVEASELSGTPNRTPIMNSDAPSADRWILQPDAQLAAVAAGNGESGIFLGIQCDPLEPIARRMILGVRQGVKAPELRALLNGAAPKILINTRSQTVRAAFDAVPEDRGHTNFAGSAEYIAAYLSPAQIEAIASANALAVNVGQRSYTFTGYGSNAAIDSMTCKSKPIHLASRLIERDRRQSIRTPVLGWSVKHHTGTAALIKGSVEASVSATAKYLDDGTTHTLGVACLEGKLYARTEARYNSTIQDDASFEKSARYIANYARTRKQLEVYKNGHRLTTIGISQQEIDGLGHRLSESDIADLIEADEIVVLSGGSTVDFPATGSSAALSRTFQSCNVARREK